MAPAHEEPGKGGSHTDRESWRGAASSLPPFSWDPHLEEFREMPHPARWQGASSSSCPGRAVTAATCCQPAAAPHTRPLCTMDGASAQMSRLRIAVVSLTAERGLSGEWLQYLAVCLRWHWLNELQVASLYSFILWLEDLAVGNLANFLTGSGVFLKIISKTMSRDEICL